VLNLDTFLSYLHGYDKEPEGEKIKKIVHELCAPFEFFVNPTYHQSKFLHDLNPQGRRGRRGLSTHREEWRREVGISLRQPQ